MLNNIQTERNEIWGIIPVYNNGKTVCQVITDCKKYLENIVVVDDGSTDIDLVNAVTDKDVVVIKHQNNEGKGAALLTGMRYVDKQGGKYAITIDADGQHFPKDIEKFIPHIVTHDNVIVIGSRNFDTDNVPAKSKIGRKIASFWLKIETGIFLDDCQSGFRAFPVKYILQLNLKGSRYDFETEFLAKAAWAGLKFKTVNIDVHYPEAKNRVSHFRSIVDNLRISRAHFVLVSRCLLPFGHKKIVKDKKKIDYALLRHPVKMFKFLLKENASPGGLAASAAVGIFLAVLPLIAVHTIVIIYVTSRLHLNKVMAVGIQNLCMPPFVPVICIEIGHYMRFGYWLTDISFETVFHQGLERIWEWFLGSLIFAPLASIIVGVAVYFIAKILQKRMLSEPCLVESKN
ncbi:hypothetical protein MNBD_UNCLBAC01-587 [hydrothermal vent metagenome]|uniref:DUF2062 domain-containing protein n=1 Tax=hydrothermal vent metagenome TaxID=652676 RepID=A0A3B1DBM8_9ZZZZ